MYFLTHRIILYSGNQTVPWIFPIETSTRPSFSCKSSPRITCYLLMTPTLFSSGHWSTAKTIFIEFWKWNLLKRASDQPVTSNSKTGAKENEQRDLCHIQSRGWSHENSRIVIGSVDWLRREWKLEKKARKTGNEVASPAAFDATFDV